MIIPSDIGRQELCRVIVFYNMYWRAQLDLFATLVLSGID